ncbi:hypothetical protein GCM10009133_28890 [Cocleimonas flava]|uniref:Uncharacterized protein DUF4397 n=1 Tax=Cocleimonas flava TaxID=634765 RepID=A0A4R1F4N7_9GAMM|nr:DUF4397 domain-containing protein [Cocleimonas flava]TCJ89266.1 uncharacterized protein DUF4397 [Cocleimonas flava]
MKRITTLLFILVSSFLLIGCGGSSSNTHDPQLRAVHLSPDAPAVDVSIEGDTALENVTYRQASGFLSLDAGSNNVKILVADTTTAVIDETLELQTDMKYTVLAVNTVANIEPIVIADDIESPTNGYAAITAVHGAPSAPPVDVYLSAPTDDFSSLSPTLQGVAFKANSGELEVPAGDYRVRITLADDSTVIYDSGTISLASGIEYIAIAAESSGGLSPIGLTILTDQDSTPFVNVDDARARLRVVHASADAPPVDISVDGSEVLSDVPFGVGSDYLEILGDSYNIDVAAAANSASVINADLTFDSQMDYTIAAVNSLNNIEPIVLLDDNQPPDAGNVKVRLIHAAPSAGLVDIYITAPDADINSISPTISNFDFKDNSDYLEVVAGDYQVRITLATTKTVAIDTGTLSLDDGQIRTAFAVDPVPGSADFGVILLADLN